MIIFRLGGAANKGLREGQCGLRKRRGCVER
jgi:hypothetical protein